jgi:hypothetical protein
MNESELTEIESLKLQLIRTTRHLARANMQTGQLLLEKLDREEAELLAQAEARISVTRTTARSTE